MTLDPMQKALRYRWIIFWILALAYVLVFFHRMCPAVVAVDMMKDLRAGGSLIGFLGSAYFYPYALMQIPAGLLSDSWGPRKTITFFFFVAFVGSILLGLAPNAFWAILGRALAGLGVAMLFVPTMKVLSEWFRSLEFATMTGIFLAMGGVGSLAATTPLAIVSSWIGWRMSFVAVGIFTLVLAVLIWVIVRDRPADMGWPSPSDPVGEDPVSPGLKQGFITVVTRRSFWPVAVWFFFTSGVFFAFGGLWGGPYLIQVYGLNKAQAGQILSMLAVGLIIGSPLLSYISNRLLQARKPVMMFSGVILIFLTAVLAFYTERIPVAGLYLICLGLGIFSCAVVVIGFTTTKELFPVQIAGTATGLVNLFPFAGGAVLQPLLGYILERHPQVQGSFTLVGYQQAFLVLFISAIIALLASLFVEETMRKENLN
ncbi:MAG: MFS transporter [Deltaproteobacteria bacterium]|nr:MFS transporter [Deltaproteobacteria bacterium]